MNISVRDIYYVIFRHKWKILLCALAGICAGTSFYFLHKPPFQSTTLLFVRYVVSEGRQLTTADEVRKSPDLRGETIMESEMAILTTFDLSKQVAEAVGAEKILAKVNGGKDVTAAADVINRGLSTRVLPRSSIIAVTFQHPDADVIQPVLENLVDKYYDMHQQIHRAGGATNDFLSQETINLKSRLTQAESELQQARQKANVISLDDAKSSASSRRNHLQEQIVDARVDLAEKTTAYELLAKRASAMAAQATETADTPPPAPAAPDMPPPEAIEQWQEAGANIAGLQEEERALLKSYREEHELVKEARDRLAAARQTRRDLEKKYPQFVRAPAANSVSGAPASPQGAIVDLGLAAAEIGALKARVASLEKEMEAVNKDIAVIDQTELAIAEIIRRRDLAQKHYMMYQEGLDQARIKETLGQGTGVQNINQIQKAPPPFVDRSKTKKTAGMAIVGGLIAGLGWAFLIELLLDRSVRRPIEFERSLGMQLFLSIPEDKKLRLTQGKKRRLRLKAAKAKDGATAESELMTGVDEAEGLRPFHETLRDRLIGYFDRRNLTHKPKLIAVTGIGSGSGVTTTTAGLARALSETGDGNVLLVDMTPGQGAALQFSRGQEVQGLESMLETRDTTSPVQDNLYIVTENANGDKLSRILPQRFSKLLPKLKSSDFDYIIFDMPPVSQISITPRLAEFMDMVLLVVESEKTDRENVQRAAALLAETKAHVGALLNKTRSYVPAWLHPEHMGSA